MKEVNEKSAQKFDAKKCGKVADMLAHVVLGVIAKNQPKSIAEGLLMITLAIGTVIQALSTVMGCDEKMVGKDFCDSLTKYFEMGGDSRFDEFAASLKKRCN